jgi:CrcB protein
LEPLLTLYLWIALGSALGGVARHWTAWAVAAVVGGDFPLGTILINIVGSFVIGFFGALTASGGRWPADVAVRHFVMIGICGGFTTFSAFSLQTLLLIRQGDLPGALANVGLSVVACLIAVWVGHAGAQALARPAPTRA